MESYVFGKESFHARTISHESVIRAPRNIQALVWEQKQTFTVFFHNRNINYILYITQFVDRNN